MRRASLALWLGLWGCVAEPPPSADPASDRGVDAGDLAVAGEGGVIDAGVDAGPPQRLYAVEVAGACPVQGGVDQIAVSVLLQSGPGDAPALTPSSAVEGLAEPLGAALGPGAFSFDALPTGPGAGLVGDGTLRRPGDPAEWPVRLQPSALSFQALDGGQGPLTQPLLVVYLMDNSGSLVGDHGDGPLAPELASDAADERVRTFDELTGLLAPDDLVSLVWFNDEVVLRPDLATPTRNRDVIRQGLTAEVALSEGGDGALGPALRAVLTSVVDANPDHQPVVVLFTDGTPDEADLPVADLLQALAPQGGRRVPVIVLDLQPAPAGPLAQERQQQLHALACGSGGDYLFLRRAQGRLGGARFLPELVRQRLFGRWVLTVDTDLAGQDPGHVVVSTALSAQVGEASNQVFVDNGGALGFWLE